MDFIQGEYSVRSSVRSISFANLTRWVVSQRHQEPQIRAFEGLGLPVEAVLAVLLALPAY